jgi:hypothetical protein
MVAATGLFATCALPSYGFDPETTALSGLTTDHTQLEISAPAQGLSVAAVRAVEFTRGDYEPADASEFEVRSARRSYNGPVIEDYLLNPRFSSVTSGNLMRAAAELVGTPYVFGGDSPAGIDCSGYVMFIFSQFGIELPHSVYQQAKLGRKIKLADAVPGDYPNRSLLHNPPGRVRGLRKAFGVSSRFIYLHLIIFCQVLVFVFEESDVNDSKHARQACQLVAFAPPSLNTGL